MSKLKLSDEQRVDIAAYLVELCDASDEHVQRCAQEWEKNYDHLENRPTGALASVYGGAVVDFPMPGCSLRAEALRDYVLGAVFGATPIMTASGSTEEAGAFDDRQSDLEFLAQKGGLEEALRSSSEDAWATNHQIVRMTWDQDRAIPVFEPIHPTDFICAGFGKFDIERSTMVGHKFNMTSREIESWIAEGLFEAPDQYNPQRGEAEQAGDHLVELAECIVLLDPKDPKAGKNRKQYLCVFDPGARTLLSIRLYEWNTKWYYSFGYKPTHPKWFWTKTPLGTSMQGPHLAYNLAFNLALYGGVSNAFPNPVVPKGTFPSKAAQKQRYLERGEAIETINGAEAVFSPKADLSDILALMPTIENAMNGVGRVSPNNYGTTTNDRRTAAEINEVAAGAQQGISGFVTTYTRPLRLMWDLLNEYVYENFESIHRRWGAKLRTQDPEVFADECDWEVSGKNASANPLIMRENLAALLQLLAGVPDPAVMQSVDWVEFAETAVSAFRFPNGSKLFDSARVREQIDAASEMEQGMAMDGAMGEMAQTPEDAFLEGLNGG